MSHDHPVQTRQPEPLTYLITGGAGFIGSHVADALISQGHHVLAIDDLSTGQTTNIQHLIPHPNFRFARASITDAIVMDRLASQADIIIHLAAAVGVKRIVEQPVYTIEMNVMGTEAVLRAALRYHAKVLIASTSEVYGKGVSVPFRENDDVLLGPTCRSRWAYAASKMVDEFLGLAYYREKDLPVVIFRLFNTVGPRQTGQYGMVVPRFVQQALRGDALTVYGDGQQSRCFLHVHDAVKAILALCDCPEAVGEVFNIGTTEEVSIQELAYRVLQMVAARTGQPGSAHDQAERVMLVPYEQAYASGFEDMQQRVPDLSKIERYVGWQPQLSLAHILDDVVQSFQEPPTGMPF